MQTKAKAEPFLQHIKSSNVSCELVECIYVQLSYLFTVILDADLRHIQL